MIRLIRYLSQPSLRSALVVAGILSHVHRDDDVGNVDHAVGEELLCPVHEEELNDPSRSLVVVLHFLSPPTFDCQEDERDQDELDGYACSAHQVAVVVYLSPVA